jgi:phage terminase large subunit GpA-like protein
MSALRHELAWFFRQARPRRVRSMRQFAEDEIVIPEGPFAGRRFRCSRQPYTALWFNAVDSGLWCRHVATGPTQSGKTLACFIIPLLYHLFEIGETVICGLPDMDMAADKWREDILPVIERSAYRDLLPVRGGGSRGGRVESMQFRHGPTLKFMSGGGGDKSRAGFSSRAVMITETDGMDQPGRTSRESDKVSQLEARTRAYGSRKRIFMECTVSTEEGRTWAEYQQGTRSRIVLPCPHCAAWVTPEREHLVGWTDAASQQAAKQAATFICPECQAPWSEDQRRTANLGARLLHEGQSIDEAGVVSGPVPPTDTLGFRWSAVNNLFLSAGELAADEWRARRSPDEENAEKEMRQFVWCIPVAPTKWQETSLEARELAGRVGSWDQGIVPTDCFKLTAAIDLGKYLSHWIVVAWSSRATGHVVDYGRIEVATSDLGVEPATLVALRNFRDMVTAGWPISEPEGKPRIPERVWIDAGYMTDVVYAFCRETGLPFMPAVGRGAAQQYPQRYNRPTSTGSIVKAVGQGFHISYLKPERLKLVEVDADYWKTWVHQRLATPLDSPGAMTFFRAPPQEHFALAKHLSAETKTEEFIAGRGVVTRWQRIRRNNHWLDALYNACAAAAHCGVRLVIEQRAARPQPTKQNSPPKPPPLGRSIWDELERCTGRRMPWSR